MGALGWGLFSCGRNNTARLASFHVRSFWICKEFFSHEVISLPEQAGEWGSVFVPIAQVRNRGLRGR